MQSAPLDPVCPCCGQRVPPLPHKLPFRGARRRIYDAVVRAGENGIDIRRLFSMLYDDDPNGGPVSGHNVISVFVSQINTRLKVHGERIIGGRSGPGQYAIYKVIKL